MKRLMTLVLTALIALAALSGCSSNTPPSEDVDQARDAADQGAPIVFADGGWDSVRFQNAVAGLIAEAVFGYTWEEVNTSTAVMIAGMERGDIDLNIEVWSDQIEAYDAFVSGGKVSVLATNFSDSEQGLYVPRYLIEGDAERGIEAQAPDLKTVEDLMRYSHLFPDVDNPSMGRIYSYVVGSTTDAVLQTKVAYYGLDGLYHCFAPGSDTLLSTAIVTAYEKGDPIVAYYWSPTWLLGQYDFVLLEDAPYNPDTFYQGACAFPPCDVTIVAGNDLIAEKPDFCEFLSRFTTTSALINEALAYMQAHQADSREAAVWFIQNHPEVLATWLNDDQIQAVQAAL